MSTSSQPEYPQPVTKADVKAAKAAYKASRPWYKKKRYLFPLALVVAIAIFSPHGGGGSDKGTTTASDETSTSPSSPSSPSSTSSESSDTSSGSANSGVSTKVTQKAHPKARKARKASKVQAATKIQTYTMPKEVGKDLQAAQDDLQGVVGHFFVSHSKDATGQDRFQVLDRDWQVCDQSVPPGRGFSENTAVTFSVVRTSESCPGTSVAPVTKTVAPKPKAKPKPPVRAMTTAQEQAIGSAQDYLSFQAFSRNGLIEQLSSDAGEGFSRADAVYAVDHIRVNYRVQAAKAAKDYLTFEHFSRSGLIEQLESDAGDGYTHAQAVYGVNAVGL
jgi:Host cell surface-exposed lipoprotein